MLRHYHGNTCCVGLSLVKSEKLKHTFSKCLHSVYYLLYNGILKCKNFNARSTFASSYLFLWRCLLLRRHYFILGRCINSAIQRYTFKALEQSGKPHSRKYSGLFAFYEELGEMGQLPVTFLLSKPI